MAPLFNFEPRPHRDLSNPYYVAWRQFLQRAEHWSSQEIVDYQLAELQRVVAHAYEHTTGYRALFDEAGAHPSMIRTLDDVRRLPFVTKEMIRDHLEEFSAPVPGRYYVTTGGSTGIPIGMYRDPVSFGKELASKAHQYARIGWREGDRQFVIRGLKIEGEDYVEFVPDFNELRCSTYQFTPETMETYRQYACRYRPQWLRCYPSSGYLFARFLLETGREFPRLQGILCSSEGLYDFQKRALQDAFEGARVFSHYGHYEMAVLAGFCEFQDTYHVLPQYGYAELVDHQGHPVATPGQVGEIVATSFIMSATPFIRYRTQDLAMFLGWSCSACGRPYQVWERIEGRLQEFIVTASGRYLSPTMINMHDDTFDSVKQFQFYQKEVGKVIFRFIPRESCDDRAVETMATKLRWKLGDDVELVMERVADIPLTGRGKHRFLVRELKLSCADSALMRALETRDGR